MDKRRVERDDKLLNYLDKRDSYVLEGRIYVSMNLYIIRWMGLFSERYRKIRFLLVASTHK